MAAVHGKCDPKFHEVRSLFEEAVASGSEVGASFAVNIDGEDVIDLWGGFVDQERTKPWNEDTIVNVWSSTKCLASLVVLKLVDQGIVDVDEKVSKYWPEFAANGKQDILVRHLLSHASGLSGWEKPVTAEDICDLEKAAGLLAEQAPWWEPGTATGYHSISFGHLLGMLVRKATGGKKTLKQIAAEEIATPLDADFQVGALEKDWPRVSPIYAPADFGEMAAPPPGSLTAKTFQNPLMTGDIANTEMWRRAEVGGANGHTNARGMNRIFSAITLGGTTRGVKILKPETVELIFKEQLRGDDLVIGRPNRFGIGYGLRGDGEGDEILSAVDPLVPKGKICFWGGWGGSIIIMDLTRKVTITYAMNQMYNGLMGNKNSVEYLKAVYKALEA
ncbi:beta-lactamase [Nemania abortiva]|nr:beta-lactamase [Nemania abortiva]